MTAYRLAFLSLLLVFVSLYAVSQPIDNATADDARHIFVNLDLLYLGIGAIYPGVAYMVNDNVSLYVSVGFGHIWFLQISNLAELGIHYFPFRNTIDGLFVSIAIRHLDLNGTDFEGNKQRLSLSGLGSLVGYRYSFFGFITTEATLGAYFTNHQKITLFEGAPSRLQSMTFKPIDFGANLRFGFSF